MSVSPVSLLVNRLATALQNNNETLAKTTIEEIEASTKLSDTPINVAMFTACCWGTMGDPSAAAKLMQKLSFHG